MLPEEEISEIVVPEWKVTYEGGFYPKRGRAGKEIKLDKEFLWANEKWHVPAVYVCTKGMVVDFCIEVDVDLVKNFINKWNEYCKPMTYQSTPDRLTIPVSLVNFIAQCQYRIAWGPLMASCILMTVPTLLIYCIFCNSIQKGLTAGAVKG